MCADSRFAEPRIFFLEGFNFVCAKPPLRRAESRFAKPRNSLHRETVLFFSLVRKERGVPQRFANLWTPGTIQISARYITFAEMTGVHHVTGRAGNRKVSGYRRWGFESVRKGYLCANARLRSFEKGMLYCKLTVGFRGWNLRLHVSLGAVGGWSFAVLRKSLSLSSGFS